MRSTATLALVLLGMNAPAFADDTPTEEVTKTSPKLSPVPDGGIYIGGGGGATPDGAASPLMMGSLAIDRHLFWRLGLWVSGEWSYVFRTEQESDFTLRLCFGLRYDIWRSDSKQVRIITDVAFAHQHEATTSMWAKYPVENALGESKFGLGHRSGVEVGGGILLTPWIDSQNWFFRRVRGLVRVSGMWLPDDRGSNLFLSVLTSVGVAI